MSSVPRPENAAKVSERVFLGFLWAGTALAGILVSFRLAVRYRAFRSLKLDDAFVVFSWILLLITAILWQLNIWRMYEQFAVATGEEPFTLQFVDHWAGFAPLVAVWNVFFYTSLWSIKVSFLLFFRQLGSRTGGFRTWWWTVFVITVCCWVPCIADINWKCSVYPIMEIFAYCVTPEAIRFNGISFIANCILDLLTDVLIISIPIIMLWPVQLKWSRKIMLMGIFSATIFVMIIAIIRVAVILKWDLNVDVSWLYFWTNLEMSLSIVIACVASFRQLFVTAKIAQENANKDVHSSWRRLLSMPSNWLSSRGGGSSYRSWPRQDSKDRQSSEHPDSSADHVPLASIHVTQDFRVDRREYASEGKAQSEHNWA